jgi:hypothetical protein
MIIDIDTLIQFHIQPRLMNTLVMANYLRCDFSHKVTKYPIIKFSCPDLIADFSYRLA